MSLPRTQHNPKSHLLTTSHFSLSLSLFSIKSLIHSTSLPSLPSSPRFNPHPPLQSLYHSFYSIHCQPVVFPFTPIKVNPHTEPQTPPYYHCQPRPHLITATIRQPSCVYPTTVFQNPFLYCPPPRP